MSQRILVSVLNWNNADLTITCLKSVFALNHDCFDVFIIDNASADNSVEAIQSAFPEQKIFVTSENLGYAGAHAIAVDYMLKHHYDALWILNNDIEVDPDSLTQLVSVFDQFGDDAMYSATPLRSRTNETIAFAAKFLHRVGLEDNTLITYPDEKYSEIFQDQSPRPVGALPGSCIFIPRSIIERFGFMSLDFFLYGEEIDYCIRLQKQGVRCLIVPDAIVYHSGEGSKTARPKLEAIVAYYRTRSMILNFRNHNRFFMVLIVIAQQLRVAIQVGLRSLRSGDETQRLVAVMILRGIVDGILRRLGKTIPPEDYIKHDASG